jgi:TetR/AcrR family transcriptional regulator
MAEATARRKGAENSKTRAQLIRCAVEILRDEGASAVTTRRLAEQVGLGRHIVHYYFGTMDELYVAMIREESVRSEEWVKEAAKTGDAVSLLWDVTRQSAVIILELTRLALRHPSIAQEYKIYTERYRQAMAAILESYARSHGISFAISPTATALMLQSVAGTVAVEASLDLNLGHDEAEKALLEWLKSLPHSTNPVS